MKKLVEKMAGVKIGKTYKVPSRVSVNAYDPETRQPLFCALQGDRLKVLDVDVMAGAILVQGPGGQVGHVNPTEFPGAKEF